MGYRYVARRFVAGASLLRAGFRLPAAVYFYKDLRADDAPFHDRADR